ncbi:unnamed protein product [Calypogeia fissa]
MAAAARPMVNVQTLEGKAGEDAEMLITLPDVMLAPIWPDIVKFVYANIAKNKRQPYAKRYAVVSALAASAIPAVVMARGHRIDKVPEVPLVLSDSVESIEKTSAAVKILKRIGAFEDVQKVKASHNICAGKGKMSR